jgi:hypothetical protein
MRTLTHLFVGAMASATISSSAIAADLNPAAVVYTLPDKIAWKQTSPGSEQAVLVGDPSKPGLYIVLTKWLPNNMSRPHFHPNDRFSTVDGHRHDIRSRQHGARTGGHFRHALRQASPL